MLVLTAYILSAAMHFLGMDGIDDDPNPFICNPTWSSKLDAVKGSLAISPPPSWKISLDILNFAKPSYLCIAEIFGGVNFHQCGKGCHILYVIINTGQKIHVIKILPMRADAILSMISPKILDTSSPSRAEIHDIIMELSLRKQVNFNSMEGSKVVKLEHRAVGTFNLNLWQKSYISRHLTDPAASPEPTGFFFCLVTTFDLQYLAPGFKFNDDM